MRPWAMLAIFAACGNDKGAIGPDPSTSRADATVEASAEADAGKHCASSATCVSAFPFHDTGDTSSSTLSTFNSYSCAPKTDESGPEYVYEVQLPQDGFLSAVVSPTDGVDVDVHILSKLDASACLDRGDIQARADVKAGTAYVVVDTFASSGKPKSGKFTIDIGFIVPSHGHCELETGEMPRVGDNRIHLSLPAIGPIVLEAHLVTKEEPAPYPTTSTDELLDHYALSQKTTGMVMARSQHWAPLEGGRFYGAGVGDPKVFPVLDEGYYVNMYWTSSARPKPGTRMILRDPKNGARSVVVSAGYETGPGNLEHIGGTPEETHFYMGTGHLSQMKLGIATDQSLPLGPRACDD